MIRIQDKKECCGCNACVQRCPKQCISMHEDNEGFLYPKVDESLCINCGLCEKVCPVINQAEPRQPLEVYAAKNPDEEIRRQSSSGGIFTMLAERTIDNGGVVFGAGFDKNWEVEHQYTETKEGIAAFRGSKYVQSNIGVTFKQAETFLKQGRQVLYSGTPCQIAGLKNFLRKEYENLLTVDIVCHGVPSPKIWQEYLKEKTLGIGIGTEHITDINFRDKSTGWKSYSFLLKYNKDDSDTSSKELASKNIYMRGFLADLYLRPSCHSCPAKELKSGSDITIADFWGIEYCIPELDDDKGISAILTNTYKGNYTLLKLNLELNTSSYKCIRQYNAAIHHSTSLSAKRAAFFTSSNETFSEKTRRLSKLTLLGRIRRKLSAVKYKLKYCIKK